MNVKNDDTKFNTMERLQHIAKDIQDHFEKRKKEVCERGKLSSFSIEMLKRMDEKVRYFVEACHSAKPEFNELEDMIIMFNEQAQELKLEINFL